MAHLAIVGLRKALGDFELSLDLQVERGELVAVLGPSGSGKSTLLRLIAGLAEPDAGSIRLAGRSLAGVPPRDRRVGMVFQDFALFPHYDVAGNVAYGLQSGRDRPPRGEIDRRVAETLERFGLAGYGRRAVDGLSGGERQRVALARAQALNPELMLFDEALGSLDAALRRSLREELADYRRRMGYTSITVTHDQEEALATADRIAVLRGGRIVQFDTAEQVYRRPASAFVASFVGECNVWTERQFPGPDRFGSAAPGLARCVRVEDCADGPAAGDIELRVAVRSVQFQGRDYLVEAEMGPTHGRAVVKFRSSCRHAPGTELRLGIPKDKLFLVPDDR